MKSFFESYVITGQTTLALSASFSLEIKWGLSVYLFLKVGERILVGWCMVNGWLTLAILVLNIFLNPFQILQDFLWLNFPGPVSHKCPLVSLLLGFSSPGPTQLHPTDKGRPGEKLKRVYLGFPLTGFGYFVFHFSFSIPFFTLKIRPIGNSRWQAFLDRV